MLLHPAVADLALHGVGPALGDVLAGEVDDGVDPGERVGSELAARRIPGDRAGRPSRDG